MAESSRPAAAASASPSDLSNPLANERFFQPRRDMSPKQIEMLRFMESIWFPPSSASPTQPSPTQTALHLTFRPINASRVTTNKTSQKPTVTPFFPLDEDNGT